MKLPFGMVTSTPVSEYPSKLAAASCATAGVVEETRKTLTNRAMTLVLGRDFAF
jgi:hypothetical protein